MSDKAQKKPFVVMRTYHAYKQTRKDFPPDLQPKGGRKTQTYVAHEESEIIYPPHPNAKFEIAQWMDDVVPWHGVGTVRVLWKVDLEEEDFE